MKRYTVDKQLFLAAMATIALTTVPAVAKDKITVGLSSAFSGHVGFIGSDARAGIEVAVNELNAASSEVEYTLVIADDECTPAGGATAFRQLMDVQQVDVIIGSGCSGATLGGMAALPEGETSAITYGSTNPKITEDAGVGGNPFMWRMNLNDQDIAKSFTDYIIEKGGTKVHILAVNNDFGRGAANVYSESLPLKNAEVLGADFYPLGTSDLRSFLSKIGEGNPSAILFFGEPPDCALLVRQMRELRLDAKIFTRGGCYTDEALSLMGDPNLANGLTEGAYWARTDDQPFVEEFRKVHGRYPPYNAALAYYAMLTVNEAVKAGSASREGITEGLAKVDFRSAIGPIKFDDHHQAYPNLFMVEVVDGAAKVVSIVEVSKSK